MAGWDFTADSEIQTGLANKLKDEADKYDGKVDEMYGQIDSLGASWVGEDYDMFKTGTEGYRGALKDLSEGIRMYAKHFEGMSDGTSTLASELIAIVQNLTGSSSSGGTAGGGTTGDVTNGGTAGVGSIGDTTGGGANGTGVTEDGEVKGVSDPSAEQETYHSSGFNEYFGSNSYYSKMGEDFKENYDFSKTTGLLTGTLGLVGGTANLATDLLQVSGNALCDASNDILESVEWLLWGGYKGYDTDKEVVNNPSGFTNPYNPEYYSNLGKEFSDNFNYEDVDGLGEGIIETISGSAKTIWDGVGVVGHAAIDTVQGGVECVEWTWNALCDGADWLFSHLV